ncbi:MAG: nucleotidyltransferase domain-containing protein [Spirochaetaceae bacterium]|jgi:predicted nucleotidyltransferase|nr:nucleotidyltransferase domain-containing protein [Spirochaetaceae bacterium]
MYTIDEIKQRVAPIARQYGLSHAWLFGSYARGEATEGSDLDIFIKEGKPLSLLDISGLDSDLRDILHCDIDVVGDDFMDLEQSFINEVKKDRVEIYG